MDPTPDDMAAALAGRNPKRPVDHPIKGWTRAADDPSLAGIIALFNQPAFARGLPTEQMRPSENIEDMRGKDPRPELPPGAEKLSFEERLPYIEKLWDWYKKYPPVDRLPPPVPANTAMGSLSDQAGYNDVARPLMRGALR